MMLREAKSYDMNIPSSVSLKFFLILLLLAGCKSPRTVTDSGTLTGHVVRIADGDTFTLLTAEKVQYRIRLHGIDCPERKQPFGSVARKRLGELLFGKDVQVRWKEKDRYGRIIGIVYSGDVCVNEQLLADGLAWHYTRYDQNPEWTALELQARNAGKGLWRDANAVAPWNWRRLPKNERMATEE